MAIYLIFADNNSFGLAFHALTPRYKSQQSPHITTTWICHRQRNRERPLCTGQATIAASFTTDTRFQLEGRSKGSKLVNAKYSVRPDLSYLVAFCTPDLASNVLNPPSVPAATTHPHSTHLSPCLLPRFFPPMGPTYPQCPLPSHLRPLHAPV